MGFGGGSGGSSSIAGASDAALSNPAAADVLSYDDAVNKWKNASLPPSQVIVRWTGTAWPARLSGAAFGVLFLSTNDPNAPAPADVNLATGDVWRRHPDAV